MRPKTLNIINNIPVLKDKDIHVITTDLNIYPDLQQQLSSLLSPDEKDRASKFKFDKHRRRFIASHGFLRHILAGQLNTDPMTVKYSFGETGKPKISTDQNPDHLCFNLSHSHELAVIAISLNTPLGVDIEHVRESVDHLGLAERYFSKEEFSKMSELTGKEQIQTFYRAWTRKEAVLKARGQGITQIENISVTLLENEPPEITGPTEEAENLSLYSLTAPAGYIISLAAEGKNHTINSFTV